MAIGQARSLLNRSDVEAILRAAAGGASPETGDALIFSDLGWTLTPIPGDSSLVTRPNDTVVLVSGDNDNIEVEGSVLRVEVDAAGSTITGVARGVDGKRLIILVPVASAGTLTMSDQDVGSDPENRFANPGGNDLALTNASQPGSVEFIYDGVESRWFRLI